MDSASPKGNATPEELGPFDESVQDSFAIKSMKSLNRIQFAKKYAQVRSQIHALSALEDNWNGYGAAKIDTAIVGAAEDIVARLPLHMLPLPQVVPMTRGRIQFEWNVGGRSLELEIESPTTVHYLRCDVKTGLCDEEILGIDDDERLTELLEWLAE